MNVVNERFKYIVLTLNLEPRQIAKELDIPLSNLYRYLRGARLPSNDILYRFAKRYHIEIVWLLFGESSNTKKDYPSLDQLDNKQAFIKFIRDNKLIVISFLKNETNFKEPIVIKTLRNSLNLSRKNMKQLMCESLETLKGEN